MWVLSRTSEIWWEHMQGRLWSKNIWGGTTAVTPKPDLSMSLWRIFCLQQRSPLCPAGHLLWAGAGLSLHCMVETTCTGVFEMNVLISYIFKNICEIWGSERWDTEVECWCQQFLFVVISGESMFFLPILRQLPVISLECAMCKAVGFHSSHWCCTPYPTRLFSVISFYSEQSSISIYPELLDFYKLS